MADKTIQILLIEDNPGDARLIQEMLADQNILVCAMQREASLTDGLNRIKDGDVDIVLLDLSLPDSQGLDTFHTAYTQAPDLPIVILSGLMDESLALDAVQAGAQDYLIKGQIEGLELARAIRYAVERIQVSAQMRIQTTALEAAANSIVITDTDGIILSVNSAFTDMTGYTKEESIGQNINILKSGQQNAAFYQNLWDTILSGEAWNGELINKRKDGSIYPEEATITPVKSIDGTVTEFISVKQDITIRKQAERSLRRQAGIIDRVYDAIVATDIKGQIIGWNKSAERLFGYGADTLRGRPLAVVYPESDTDTFYSMILENIEPSGSYEIEAKMCNAAGAEVYVDLTVLLLEEDDEPTELVWYMVDRTGHRALEEQLRQSQKMEAVGKLAGGVAHDFNNLLTVINGYSELMIMTLPEDDPLSRNAGEIKKAGVRAAALTTQLLAFSRRQILQPRLLNLNDIIQESTKMLHRLIGEDIELTTNLAPDLCMVKADMGQIDQVILNLVVNARDAMPTGGSLMIETANIDLDESFIQNHIGAQEGPHAMLAVSDTGCGMDTATQERIFEPFFTTKSKDKGTGLGLSTIYGIIKQSNGSVWVYSEIGKGTTFKVYLPESDEDGTYTRSEIAQTGISGGTETLLLVEDEEDVRLLAEKILSAKGYTVIKAADGPEAIRLAGLYQKPIHLLITDVVMPKMSGRELADRLAALYPDTKTMFMSGYTDDAILRHGVLEAGINFLQKPFTLASLLSGVREALDTHANGETGAHHK